MEDMRVYIVNLSRYVSGELTGAWFSLPVSREDVEERLHLSTLESEIAIHDTENVPFEVGEYLPLEELNRMYHLLEELPEGLVSVLRKFVWNLGSMDEVVQAYENGQIVYYPSVESVEDLAYYLIDELGVLGEIPDRLRFYIDYEAYARDFEINHMIIDAVGGLFVIYT